MQASKKLIFCFFALITAVLHSHAEEQDNWSVPQYRHDQWSDYLDEEGMFTPTEYGNLMGILAGLDYTSEQALTDFLKRLLPAHFALLYIAWIDERITLYNKELISKSRRELLEKALRSRERAIEKDKNENDKFAQVRLKIVEAYVYEKKTETSLFFAGSVLLGGPGEFALVSEMLKRNLTESFRKIVVDSQDDFLVSCILLGYFSYGCVTTEKNADKTLITDLAKHSNTFCAFKLLEERITKFGDKTALQLAANYEKNDSDQYADFMTDLHSVLPDLPKNLSLQEKKKWILANLQNLRFVEKRTVFLLMNGP